MLPKSYAALFLICFFILSWSAPALASSGHMRYDKYYNLDGRILLKIQTGDKNFSPAQHKTLVEGRGAFKRDESIYIEPGEISVTADSDWEVDEHKYRRGLLVGSAVKLNPGQLNQNDAGAEQVFAVKLETDPGEEGRLDQEWNASEQLNNEESESMFVIDQDAYTSGGKMKRYIDMICPASMVYLFEDSVIEGYAEVTDILRPAGSQGQAEDMSGSDPEAMSPEEVEVELPDGEAEPEGQEGFDPGEDPDLKEPELDAADEEPDPDPEKKQEQVFILDSEEFQTTVPPGTPLEEIAMEQTVSLTIEIIEITGIEIEWDQHSNPAYDPDQEGSYIFIGRLHFPDYIKDPYSIVTFYTVHVTNDPDFEED